MSKRSKQAEALADRILAAIRPQVVKMISMEFDEMTRGEAPGAVELSDKDVAEAEAVVSKWSAKKGARHA